MVDIRKIRKRGRIVFIFILVVGAIFVARAAQVQIVQHKKFAAYADSQQRSAMPLKARRGSIYDSQGKLLAYDLESRTYSVNPKYINDKTKAARQLTGLAGKSMSHWLREFKKHPGYLVVATKVPKNREEQFDNSSIETLRYRSEMSRVYPYEEIVAEVIGRTDTDGKGISGLEMYYDDMLAGIDGSSVYLRDARGNEITSWEQTLVKPVDGMDLHLAIDLDLQQIVMDELATMLDSSRSLWATAIFIDAERGGVLACGTVECQKRKIPRCRSIVDMNEPGSTAKIMPLVTVFQAGIFEPDDIINVEGGRFNIGRRVIRDDHPHDSLRCDEIGIYSSNIGVSKMGIRAGSDLIFKTLVQYGLGAKTGIDFPGEPGGVLNKPEKWTDHLLANICFGYGIMVTGVQMVSAYGVIANGGELLRPYFASKAVESDGTVRILNSKRVIREIPEKSAIETIRGILRQVVQVGTARKARDERSLVAGKTGTALRTKKEGRGYDPTRSLASFAGYFPAASPKVVGIVMFDEPQTSIYGGEISAPVFKRIAVRYSSLPRNYAMLDYPDESVSAGDYSQEVADEHMDIASIEIDRKEEVAVQAIVDQSLLPDFKGDTMRDAIRKVRALGLDCKVSGGGVVESQEPRPGVPIGRIETVELVGGL